MNNRSEFRVHRLLARISDHPLAVTREVLEVVLGVLGEKEGVVFEFDDSATDEATHAYSGAEPKREREERPYAVENGNAIIPIRGELVSRVSGLKPYSGLVGYNQISRMVKEAMNDDEVERLVLDIDSPGGEVSGLFDTVDEIFELRGQKPMISVVDDGAYSAAYALASATDRIIVPRTGGVGSIGTIAVHCDMSGAMKKAGYKATIVHAGKHKKDFNRFEPLTKQALERLQKLVDSDYALLVNTVARNRGMEAEAIRATEALTYDGQEGVDIGLADEVSSMKGILGRTDFVMPTPIETEQEANTMSIWQELCEPLGLDVKETDEENRDQVLALFKKLEAKGQAENRATEFCQLHEVESLDAMTVKVQSMVPAEEAEALRQKLLRVEAEQRVAELMRPETGKIAAANKDWAIDFYMRDKEGFEKVMAGAPKLIPPPPPDDVTKQNEAVKTGEPQLDPTEKAELEKTFGKDKVQQTLKELKHKEKGNG